MSSASNLFRPIQRTAPAAGLFGAMASNPAVAPKAKVGKPGQIIEADDRETFAGQFRAGTHAKPAARPDK